ncbi:MAG: tRNA1(Val) (adenine(37)-N6)-methyltransferase [Pelovirga sp.]
MRSSETLDQLLPGNLCLWQAKSGHRYSIDAVLLASFARSVKCRCIADLGTGNGVLPLLLAYLSRAEVIYGLEVQQSMAQRARRNVELNKLENRITIVAGDVRHIKQLHPQGAMDLVVSNPPYRSAGSGRIAPDEERALARHELAGTIEDFAFAASWLLSPGGAFSVVYLAERLGRLFAAMTQAGIEPKRMRMVHSTAASGARLVLLEGCKSGRPGLDVEKPLMIYADNQERRCYTEEVEQMYCRPGAD